jgi:hypothetical protein
VNTERGIGAGMEADLSPSDRTTLEGSSRDRFPARYEEQLGTYYGLLGAAKSE